MDDKKWEEMVQRLEKFSGRAVQRAHIEMEEEWMMWAEKIPSIQFPAHWKVKVVPPFVNAIARFFVSLDGQEKDRVSVYLDCYDRLGFVGEPYWEVYPVNDDTERILMNDIAGLLDAISRGLKEK